MMVRLLLVGHPPDSALNMALQPKVGFLFVHKNLIAMFRVIKHGSERTRSRLKRMLLQLQYSISTLPALCGEAWRFEGYMEASKVIRRPIIQSSCLASDENTESLEVRIMDFG